MGETKKCKRVSKKRKYSWRKNIKINDVEDYLEDQRFNERVGLDFDNQRDDDLFVIDTKPETSEPETIEPLTSKQIKKLNLLQKQPKCYSILTAYSAVPIPITSRKRKNSDPVEAAERKKLKKDRKNTKKVAKSGSKSFSTVEVKCESFDGINSKMVVENLTDIWNYDSSKKPKRHAKKPSVLPAVELPHPGLSYNPSFKDHQALLKEIADKELLVMKEQKHLNRVTHTLLRKVPVTQVEKTWMTEMSSGLFDKDNNNEPIAEGNISVNPPVKNKKKVPQKKKKRLELKKKEHLREIGKLEKKKVSDIYKLRFIKSDIEKTIEKQEKTRQKKNEIKKEKLLAPKRLAKKKFEELDPGFNLAREISGNLRNIKPEGNLLTDRYNSMQKRNILEASEMVVRRKSKVKKFIRPGMDVPGRRELQKQRKGRQPNFQKLKKGKKYK